MVIIKDIESEESVCMNCHNFTGGNHDPATGGGLTCGGSVKD